MALRRKGRKKQKRRWSRRRPGSRSAAVAIMAPLLALAALFAVSPGGGGDAAAPAPETTAAPAAESSPSPTPETVDSYLEKIKPLAESGGRVVKLGMEQGLSDIEEGALDDELLIDSTQGWARSLRQVKGDWQALVPPPEFEEAHQIFVQALDRYISVATVLEEAARVPVEERPPFIDLAVKEGDTADSTWDEAAAIIQAHVTSGGDPALTWLPDPESSNSDTDDGREGQ